jgi:transcriptional regulator with XRE-family HTH domain
MVVQWAHSGNLHGMPHGTQDPIARAHGEVIGEEPKRAHLSQEALPYRCKLHPTYINQLERGKKSPTVRALLSLASALGTTASELLRTAEGHAQP